MKKQSFYIFLGVFITFIFVNGSLFLSLIFNAVGNYHYKNYDFIEALENYTRSHKLRESPEVLYNIGNTKFRLFQAYRDIDKLYLLEESLGSYKLSLDLQLEKETGMNYIFVKSVFENLETSSSQRNSGDENREHTPQDITTGDTDKTDISDSGDNANSSTEDNQGAISNNADTKGKNKATKELKYKLKLNQIIPELTDEEREKIEMYIIKLQQEVENHSGYFHKSEDILEKYRKDPYFQKLFGK